MLEEKCSKMMQRRSLMTQMNSYDVRLPFHRGSLFTRHHSPFPTVQGKWMALASNSLRTIVRHIQKSEDRKENVNDDAWKVNFYGKAVWRLTMGFMTLQCALPYLSVTFPPTWPLYDAIAKGLCFYPKHTIISNIKGRFHSFKRFKYLGIMHAWRKHTRIFPI